MMNIKCKAAVLSAAMLLGPAADVMMGRQAPVEKPSGFEVASVKPNRSGLPNINFGLEPGGRFTATNAPLREIIRTAYKLPDFQIVDAPGWIRSERFDIIAKAEGNPTPDEIFMMIRTLLAERFKLSVHNEKRELPIYAIVRLRPSGDFGPRFRPAAVDCDTILAAARKGAPLPPAKRVLCGNRLRPGTLAVGGMTMEQIAQTFTPLVGRIVVDRTGLEGRYDLDLDFAPDQTSGAAPPPTDAPSIFTAVQEQLGLKLQSDRGPVDVLVIAQVERPTPD